MFDDLNSNAVWQLTSVEDMRHNVEALEKVSAELKEARLECDDINREEDMFEWEMTQFPQLEAMMQAKDPYEKLWMTAYHFSVVSEQWMNGNSLSACGTIFGLTRGWALDRLLYVFAAQSLTLTFDLLTLKITSSVCYPKIIPDTKFDEFGIIHL